MLDAADVPGILASLEDEIRRAKSEAKSAVHVFQEAESIDMRSGDDMEDKLASLKASLRGVVAWARSEDGLASLAALARSERRALEARVQGLNASIGIVEVICELDSSFEALDGHVDAGEFVEAAAVANKGAALLTKLVQRAGQADKAKAGPSSSSSSSSAAAPGSAGADQAPLQEHETVLALRETHRRKRCHLRTRVENSWAQVVKIDAAAGDLRASPCRTDEGRAVPVVAVLDAMQSPPPVCPPLFACLVTLLPNATTTTTTTTTTIATAAQSLGILSAHMADLAEKVFCALLADWVMAGARTATKAGGDGSGGGGGGGSSGTGSAASTQRPVVKKSGDSSLMQCGAVVKNRAGGGSGSFRDLSSLYLCVEDVLTFVRESILDGHEAAVQSFGFHLWHGWTQRPSSASVASVASAVSSSSSQLQQQQQQQQQPLSPSSSAHGLEHELIRMLQRGLPEGPAALVQAEIVATCTLEFLSELREKGLLATIVGQAGGDGEEVKEGSDAAASPAGGEVKKGSEAGDDGTSSSSLASSSSAAAAALPGASAAGLVAFIRDLERHLADKQRALLLAEARKLLLQEAHDSVRVPDEGDLRAMRALLPDGVGMEVGGAQSSSLAAGEKKKGRKKGGGGGSKNKTAAAAAAAAAGGEGAEGSSGFMAFPPCKVTASTRELVLLAYRILDDAAEVAPQNPRLSMVYFRTARDVVDLFRAIVPVVRAEQAGSVPRLAMLLHNDAMYIAHHLLTMGHQHRE
eukprot:g1847.t1